MSAENTEQFERLKSMAETLGRHEQVAVTRWNHGPPATDEQLYVATRRLGAPLAPAIERFYRAANGACLVWFDRRGSNYEYNDHVGETFHDFPPSRSSLADQSPADGALYLPPIERVFSYPCLSYSYDAGEPVHLYGEHIDRQAYAARIYPFDLPEDGSRHAAFVIEPGNGDPAVIGVTNHSCFTDSYFTTFESYMEAVLATWASLDARMAHLLTGAIRSERGSNPKGDGAAHWKAAGIPLASILRC